MNTTKRKFNALLNGLGNKKSDSSLSAHEVNKTPDKPQNDTDSNMKKPRISYSSSSLNRLPSLTRASSAAPSEFDSARQKLAPVYKLSATPVSHSEPPKWAPYDRAEFLKRLKSFSNLTDWTPKPARVNEVEWAKRGWVCQKKERVRCCFCNVEILVKLNKKEEDGKEKEVYIAENIENALIDKYVELIVTSHDESCPWRQRGCDDVIFKLPLNKPAVTIQTLRERYDELQQRAEHLPYLSNMTPPEGLDIDRVITYLPRDFLKSSPEAQTNTQSEINKVALMMSLCGWQGHKHDRLGHQLESVSCQTCYRILGLWMFKSKSISATGKETEPAIVSGLDPIAQHREYCPWRNPVSQNGLAATQSSKSRELAGWEVVLRVLKSEHGLRAGREKNEKGSRRSYIAPTMNEASGEDGNDLAHDFADDEDAKSIRDAKDKDLMARLRRVKTFIALKKRPSGEVKNKRFSAA
ncbi:f2dc6154-6610-4cfe-979e-992d250a1979 [Sclerotinia trifoliorum]|uniref:F2dc6154-6610-4cfe-979e-992d250a1979 n=1 Tax=Sclerotinia trifoliorum TaxID=28548 RepID=A0A8H2W2B1_9HELO|nr:f2dc6154-6610-4cfe-979e-992d250a1979 [Sclerotinia trifoliorum]